MAAVAAIMVAAGLSVATPSYAAKRMLISGSGVGPYKMGTTGKEALHSKLYTKPKKINGCPIIPPSIRSKKARRSIGINWSGKSWTKRSEINKVWVWGKKVGKQPVRTKQGVGVDMSVITVRKKVKHLRQNGNLGKYVPVLSTRSGKRWINFVVNNFNDNGKKIKKWSKLRQKPVSAIVVANTRLPKMHYGGAGGC